MARGRRWWCPRLGLLRLHLQPLRRGLPDGRPFPSYHCLRSNRQSSGKAEIDENRCIHGHRTSTCIVCQEVCPLTEKAIAADDMTVTNDEGLEIVVRRPVVVRSRCIGCGLCEHWCPVKGEVAIRVYPDDGEGEHRRRGRS